MFEKLSDRLERSFKILKGQGKITEINVAETLKDVRRALIDADVNYKVAKTFTDTVKQKLSVRMCSLPSSQANSWSKLSMTNLPHLWVATHPASTSRIVLPSYLCQVFRVQVRLLSQVNLQRNSRVRKLFARFW